MREAYGSNRRRTRRARSPVPDSPAARRSVDGECIFYARRRISSPVACRRRESGVCRDGRRGTAVMLSEEAGEETSRRGFPGRRSRTRIRAGGLLDRLREACKPVVHACGRDGHGIRFYRSRRTRFNAGEGTDLGSPEPCQRCEMGLRGGEPVCCANVIGQGETAARACRPSRRFQE